MPEYIVHTLITLVALPTISFIIVRLISRADLHKEKEETQWRNQVMNNFAGLKSELSSYCALNKREHEEFHKSKNDLTSRVSVIEATQRHLGCDRPRRRQDDA